MRTFPAGDRVRGLNISDCSSPESFTCSKGEFLKCTEDDRAWRTRMVAGCPSLAPPFFGQARKVVVNKSFSRAKPQRRKEKQINTLFLSRSHEDTKRPATKVLSAFSYLLHCFFSVLSVKDFSGAWAFIPQSALRTSLLRYVDQIVIPSKGLFSRKAAKTQRTADQHLSSHEDTKTRRRSF